MKPLPKRVSVSTEFLDAIASAGSERLRQINAVLASAEPWQREAIVRDNAMTIARIKRLLDRPTRDQAREELATRLRGLPFSEYCSDPYSLVGITKDIIIEDQEHRMGWDMGPYQVQIPWRMLHSGNYQDSFHFIPLRDPLAEYHHPHHRVNGWTCWGEFNPIIASVIRAFDIPEILRTCSIYLSRYNPRSVLSARLSTEFYPFAKEIHVYPVQR